MLVDFSDESVFIQRAKIKDGWHEAGKECSVLGPPIMCAQLWTPVLFDDQEDPEFFKSAGLTMNGNGKRSL